MGVADNWVIFFLLDKYIVHLKTISKGNVMSRTVKILTFIFSLVLIAILISCASSNKNPYYEKRKNASHVNTTQVGRNKYFFSPTYQKKLNKSYKKR